MAVTSSAGPNRIARDDRDCSNAEVSHGSMDLHFSLSFVRARVWRQRRGRGHDGRVECEARIELGQRHERLELRQRHERLELGLELRRRRWNEWIELGRWKRNERIDLQWRIELQWIELRWIELGWRIELQWIELRWNGNVLQRHGD